MVLQRLFPFFVLLLFSGLTTKAQPQPGDIEFVFNSTYETLISEYPNAISVLDSASKTREIAGTWQANKPHTEKRS